MRVTSGPPRRKKHKKILKITKGFRGMNRTAFKKAHEAAMKSGQHSYKDRRRKKRDFRGLWITRINAAVRAEGVQYSRFIKGLKEKNIQLNRKTLSELAIHEPEAFKKIVETVRN